MVKVIIIREMIIISIIRTKTTLIKVISIAIIKAFLRSMTKYRKSEYDFNPCISCEKVFGKA